MKERTAFVAALVLIAACLCAAAELATGIRQIKEGDFEAALVTLDAVVRQLQSEPEREQELAQAYLYLGSAYVGLGSETLARTKFRLALQSDPGLHPSPEEFSAKVRRIFEAAREAERGAELNQKAARKRRGKGGLILLGVGGAAAAGLAVTLTHERDNTPPTAAIAFSPEGQAIKTVTNVTFTASGADADGDALSYSWRLGDGSAATGPSVSKIYPREGTFQVQLEVSDGLATTTASTSVTAGTLLGTWRLDRPGLLGVVEFFLGFPYVVSAGFAGGERSRNFDTLMVTHPRNVSFRYADRSEACPTDFTGMVDPTLQVLTGRIACEGGRPSCPCLGRTQTITARRQ